MDTISGGGTYDLNEAVWTVDLTGKTAATLAWADTLFSDESDFLPATFTGHYAGDGVAVSGDGGTTWVTISNAPGGTSGGWVTRSVDLAATALAAGWALGPSFKIKFQQYDNYDITTDGRGYDNITLSAPLPSDDHYSLRATAGQALRVTTATPGADPAGEFANALDPVIDLYDPSGALVATDDNSAPDGRNALIDFVATAAGVYTVRVRAANNTRGEYVLDAHQYSLAGGVTDQPDLLAASDTGVSGTDNVTRLDNATPGQAPRFLVPGTAPGATVTLYADGVAVASAVATGYSTVLTLDGASRLTDGPHVFVARQTPAGGTASADSAPLTLTVVTTPSTAPTAPVLQAASDSGLSASDGVTNDATPTFDVTPGGAPYLRLYRNGVAVADFLPAGDAVTLPGQPDGTFTFAFSAVDVAGNESPVGPTSAPLTIDTAAPAAPVAPDLQASSDTGFSTSDNVTGVSAPVFDLGTPAGAYFRVYRAGVLVSPGYGAGPSFAAPAQSDGTALWTSSYVDLAGNESLASPAVTVGIDTVAPATPPALDLQAASDGGGSDTDNVTNDATPTFDVAGAAPYFRVYKDGVLLSGTYATGTTYTPSALANGTYVFTVVAVDAAGNASGASAPISVTVDTSILSAPALSAASDTGILTTDRLTRLNNATPATALDFVVPGTAAGATVTLYADGVAIGSAVSAAGGTITVRTDGVTVIPDGARAITFRQILPGESESADSGFVAVTVDSVAPVAPAGPDMLDANDTGFSATDNVTTNKTPGFTVAPGAGAYYRLFVDGVQRGADYQTGTVTLGTTADGTYAATAFAIDAAGNVSPLSAATSFTIDTVAPAAPTLAPDLQDASDTGVSNADNVTRILAPTFDIPGAGGSDTYFRVYSAGSLISGSYQSGTTYTAGTQFNGTFAHTVALVDAAGNVSAQGPGLTVTFDSFAPGFPSALDLQAASDTGLSSTDNNTRQTNPTFNVSVSAGNYFRVYRAGTLVSGSYETGTTFTTAVTDGTYAFTNTAVDAAGNESSVSSSLSLTIDTVAPSAPSAPDMTVSTDSGFSTSDNVTANATPGFTVAGTTYYRLLVDGAQLTGDYQTGTFTLPAQSDGTYAATASAVDLAGNASAPSTATGFTIDRVAPAAPTTAPNLQAASDSGVSATDDLTRINVPTFDVPGVAAADYFRVYRNGTLISGNFQAGATYTTGSTQSTGTFAYTYAVADAAGNVSTQGPGLSVTYDTTAPSAPGALD
ncbi:MAG: beta strand repeat-containing protein, partial [Phycisphaerae bacterium]